MKKNIFTLIILSLMVLVLSACGANEGTESSNEDEATAKVAIVFGTGGLGDKAFNDIGHAGLVKAKEELGIEFDYVEPSEISEFETNHREFAKSGDYDLIIGLGFDQVDAVANVAAEFPEQKFLLTDAVVDAPNVTSVTFKDYEKAFLIGAIAAQTTESNKLGFVGGVDIPLIHAFGAGFTAGAKYINEDIEVATNYVGAFNDPNTAKEMATSIYDNGADIVYAAAGGSGLGVFSAAKEEDKYAIGVDVNQNSIDPDHIMLSSIRKMDTVIFDQIEKVIAGNFEAGVLNLGVAEDAVGYTVEESNVEIPQEVLDVVAEIQEKITSGEIVAPQTFEEIDGFLASIQ